jgi:outer membrane protein assembly factor BamB
LNLRRFVAVLCKVTSFNSFLADLVAPLRRIRHCAPSSLVQCWLLVAAVLGGAGGRLLGAPPAVTFDYTAAGPVNSTPAIGADGSLYFGAEDNRVYAVLPNGTNRWQFSTGGQVWSSPALGPDETVYFGSLDGQVYAVTPAGQKAWSFKTGGEIYASPAVGTDGSIYIASMDQRLYALTPAGGQKWVFGAGGGIYSSPSVGPNGTIYFGARDGRLYAVKPNGTGQWTYPTGDWVDATPAIGPDGTIYAASRDSLLYAINPDGTKRWTFHGTAGFYASPAVGFDGRIYAADNGGRVFALQPDGTLLWQTNVTDHVNYASVAVTADGTVFVGSQDGLLTAISSAGAIKWAVTNGGRINYASPAVAPNGFVYVGAEDGHVRGIVAGGGPMIGGWPTFRRDARHAASGSVSRGLPAGYSGGADLVVTLAATPAAGTSFYTVEDTPPAGWTVTVTNLSDNGWFDSANRRVKFGPFFDHQPRQLTYHVTPPIGASGTNVFTGTSSADGGDRFVGGLQVLTPAPLHPADALPADGWLTLTELTAYGAAWKRGTSWTIGPNPIPGLYLAQAIDLWTAGEAYHYDTNYIAPPSWWTPLADGGVSLPPPPALPAGVATTKGTISADLTDIYDPTVPVAVTLTVTPATNVVVYAVEDQPPSGWTVAAVSGGGFYDAVRGKVKWGPFFDTQPRQFTYQVTSPAGETNQVFFSGHAAFDGAPAEITGQRDLLPRGALLAGFARRFLPDGYSAGATFNATIVTHSLTDISFYVIEDTPPAGWSVGQVSDNGVYDAINNIVRFGPFFDGLGRTLSYQVTPPLTQTGSASFSGTFFVDDLMDAIVGDSQLAQSLLHPADTQPVDGWLTLGEVTTYGAAWKNGLPWPLPPSPIPTAYVQKAIQLWQGGEFYGVNTNITNAPQWWVNLTNPPLHYRPAAIAPGTTTTNGTVAADRPKFFTVGAPFPVTFTVTPTNIYALTNPVTLAVTYITNTMEYAVEDQVPAGWTVSQISETGVFDTLLGKVKWGPFFDANPRTLIYQVTPPTSAADVVQFYGGAAFDNGMAYAVGRSQMFRSDAGISLSLATPQYLPGVGLQLTLSGITNELYLLQTSTNLTNWTTLLTFTNTGGPFLYLDSSATNYPWAFYRTLWP